MPNPPSERGGPQLVSTNTALYVLFGFSGHELGDVHQYDLTQNQWTELKLAGSVPPPRSVVSINNYRCYTRLINDVPISTVRAR